ncbi:MAG: NAD(P)-dependent oxidoreductase [Myxococcota bacterium]
MSEVLLTGGTGFVGRHVVRPLVERGYRVLRVRSVATAPEPCEGVEELRCDLLDPSALEALFGAHRPQHWLHLAWYTEHGRFWDAPQNLDWLAASARGLRHFVAHGGRRVVMAGTCAEYGPGDAPCDEHATPLTPGSLYATSKRALCDVLRDFAAAAGLSAAWGRIFQPYGPGEPAGRLLPSVIDALQKGEPVRCTHGRQVRDWMYVEDVAAAFAALLDSEVEGAVNIGSGVRASLREVVETVAKRSGVANPTLEFGALPARPDEPQLLVAATERLTREVGWSGARDLAAGLDATLDASKLTRGPLARAATG